MKKADQKRLAEALDKALAPPKPKPKQNLDALLNEYDDSMVTMPSHPSPPSPPSLPSTPKSSKKNVAATKPSPGVAPERDFMRVANSITREAVPSGLFTGKSKQLYDYLYSLTRGAIVPARTIRVTRERLMKGSGIGAKITLEQNISRLKSVGLIEVTVIGGVQGGNEYTVFMPEEITIPSPPSLPSGGQKLGGLGGLETSPPRYGLSADGSMVSGDPQTSIKTIGNDDDEAFAGLNEILSEAVRELTGKDVAASDSQKFRELGELLTTELKIAAARTTVSNVPAFLTEHLRRRLWKVDKKQNREMPAVEETKTALSEDARNCPECGGTGFYYPNGYEGGVAKCKHEKLGDGGST